MPSSKAARRWLGLAVLALAWALTLAVASAAFAAEPLRIGFFSPVSGPGAPDGTSALRGAQLAVEYLNGRGGVLGRSVELVHYDDRTNAAEAVNVATRLVQVDRVPVAVSGSYSGPTRSAAGVFQRNRVPLVAAYAVHPDIPATGSYVFSAGMPAAVEGKVAAYIAVRDLGARRISVLTMDIDAGVSISNPFIQKARELGAEIVSEDRYSPGETDFRPILRRLRRLDPDVIYATAYFAEAAQLVTQLRELGMTQTVVGMEGFDSPVFLELAKGDSAEGTIFTTDLDRDSSRPIVRWFLQEFKRRYGTDADMVGASAFTAVQLVAEAIRRAGGTDPDAVVAALHAIRDFDEALTGFQRFLPSRRAVRPVVAQVVKGGEFHLFGEYAQPELIEP